VTGPAPEAAVAAGRDLLFLCHRIPYPPDKGDKIRSYHWLRALASAYRVHLAAFVDDPADWVHRPQVEALCASCLLLPLRPAAAKLRSLMGLATGEPLSLPYYRDPRLARWLEELRSRRGIGRVVVYSSAMAQYAAKSEWAKARRVIDFVDVDSDKWRQYAQARRGPMRWVYAREAAKLETFDLAMARVFDASLFVSPVEAQWFRDRLGAGAERVTYVDNGVDAVFFDPGLAGSSPYPPGVRAVVFTGAMDYWANAEAVTWFCREVWPRVLAEEPRAVFYIVGSRPGEAVQALASEAVVVTGRVPDVRPYLGHADAVVVPMRIARGIQNKVLEGMAMARPVIVSSKGLEGISARHGQEVLVADEAEDVSRCLCDVLRHGAHGVGLAARETVRRDYAWEGNARRLLDLVEGGRNAECGVRNAE
jgi:sugar transferase (PEP-CTERM/EpsH1 system associated)